MANTLISLGYEPVWQDVFGTEGGDLRGVLRKRIDEAKGVVQLIGQCYGAEPLSVDAQFGRVSYTQYEALYARSRAKKVWYLFIDNNFPSDPHDAESEEVRELQAEYRRRVQSDAHLFHPLASQDALEASVLKLRNDLERLRRGVKQWAAGVVVLLVLIAGLVVWLLRGQASMTAEMAKLRQGLVEYPEVELQLRRAPNAQNASVTQEQIYSELGKQLGIDPTLLREKLPQVAEEIRHASHADIHAKAGAAYIARDYVEAERLALQAAEEVKNGRPDAAVDALELAGSAAEKRAQLGAALEHFRAAEKLTDPKRDPENWAEVRNAIAGVARELETQNAEKLDYKKSESDLKQ